MKKIESLTAEQERDLIEYRDKMLAIGRSCEPADRPKAERVFRSFYERIGKSPPYIWWFDGPAVGSIVRTILRNDNLGANLVDNLGANLRASLAANLGASLRANLWDNLVANLRASLAANLGDSLRANLWDNLDWGFWGAHEFSWQAYYRWPHISLRPMHPPKDFALLCEWIDISNSCGWWTPFEGVVFACERPLKQQVNSRGRLHCEDGPAFVCRDGWEFYSLDGITLTEQIVMRPESQTVEQISGEQNNDIRSIRIERFGWPRYLKESGAKCRHSRKNEIEGTREALYRTPSGEQRLVVTCQTGRVFALGCPPNVETCEQAQNYLGGGKKRRIVAAT